MSVGVRGEAFYTLLGCEPSCHGHQTSTNVTLLFFNFHRWKQGASWTSTNANITSKDWMLYILQSTSLTPLVEKPRPLAAMVTSNNAEAFGSFCPLAVATCYISNFSSKTFPLLEE